MQVTGWSGLADADEVEPDLARALWTASAVPVADSGATWESGLNKYTASR